MGVAATYAWLSEQLDLEFEKLRLLKESPRVSVELIWHWESVRQFILRRFTGNGEVYRKLLDCSCRYLPIIYEAAERDGECRFPIYLFVHHTASDANTANAFI